MTTLTKLGVQGIRSFSGERMESLEFERPVTLIVGHNGAGKTTIIECLKMATCGQLPPNCDKGHGFVHDPNVAGVPEVKGQIRLLFRTGVKHEHVCATRTFQLSNVRGKNGAIKSTFKALENLLRVKDKDGDNNSNSRRCADMDMMIPELMGVSRPILEHVIFCHQEDSNWPLAERIILKKRFDEIFGSSRYTKALETIDKKRKETAKEAKDKSHVLELVSKDREIAVGLRVEYSKLEASSLEMEGRIKGYSDDIGSAESTLLSLQKLEQDNRSSVDKIRDLSNQLEALEGASHGDGAGCSNDMSDEESIESLSEKLCMLESEKMEKSSQVVTLKSEFSSALSKRNETSAKLRLIRKSALEDSNTSNMLELKSAELAEVLAGCATKFGVDDIESFFTLKKAEKQLLVKSHQDQVMQYDAEVQQLQKSNLGVSQKKFMLESELRQLYERSAKAKADMERIDTELGGGSMERTEIESNLLAEISKIDQQLEVVKSKKNESDIGQLIRAKSVLVGLLREAWKSMGNEALVGADDDDRFLESLLASLRKKIGDANIASTDPTVEGLWNARSAGKIYSTLKQKSVQTSQCQFCRGPLGDTVKFEANINKHLEKLPGIIAEFENKLGIADTSSHICLYKLMGQVELVQQFSARIAAASSQGGNSVSDLDRQERVLNSLRTGLVIKSQRLDTLFMEKDMLLVGLDESGERCGVVEKEIAECVMTEGRLGMEIEKVNDSKKSIISQYNSQVAGLEKLLNEVGNSVHVIGSIRAQLQQLRMKAGGTQNTRSNELVVLEQTEADLNATTSQLMDSLTHLEGEIETMVGEISSLTRRIQYMRISEELRRIQAACVNCPKDIVQQISKLSSELMRLRELRSQLVGQSSQVKLQVNEIRAKMANYVDIDEKHRQALIQFETLNMVTKDVARYHQALDRALMQYHVTKMNEINFHLRELWERVYKGTDIDFIAIRSDTEEEGGDASGTAKRSYNYRVVMAKNDVELEMRGRCSAGQKVLASLIIRLVLAESFSVNCGILALDEPTTNLDRANISGLAQALAELIESRRAEKNFQLVIITHDESFVRMLGRLQACDSYYRVTKDDGGHSTISRAAIYELNA